MGLAIAGVIEGFYGPPWLTEERLLVMSTLGRQGMGDYVYAPKDDPKHRADWRVPYTDEELADFERLGAAGTMRFGFGISPGLSIDCSSPMDRADLLAKCDQVIGCGARLVVLCLDDIPFGGGPQGVGHAGLTSWLRERLDGRADLALVPTEYVGIHETPYLDALAAGLPDDVPVGWTGDAVVNDSITAAQARRRAEALRGRAPLLWDNVPVNDGLMGDRLHLGPLWGRDAGLVADGLLGGYLANPMVQPAASLLPLVSIAAWLRGADPLDAWAGEADRRGWRVFAEACDGEVPRALVATLASGLHTGRLERTEVDAVRDWFAEAAIVEAPGIDESCQPWIEAVRDEASVALSALDLVAGACVDAEPAGGLDMESSGAVFMLGFQWRRIRASRVSVMGPRLGFQPSMGQAPDGRWAFRRSSVLEDQNAVDVLCRLAFDAAAMATD